MGPPGNCPCIRAARGEKIPTTEINISDALFQLLTEEEQKTINTLKMTALSRYLQKEPK